MTVIKPDSRRPSETCAMPRPTILCAGRRSIRSPANFILPEDGRVKPEIARRMELFPVPFAPRRAMIFPSSRLSDTPLTASICPLQAECRGRLHRYARFSQDVKREVDPAGGRGRPVDRRRRMRIAAVDASKHNAALDEASRTEAAVVAPSTTTADDQRDRQAIPPRRLIGQPDRG